MHRILVTTSIIALLFIFVTACSLLFDDSNSYEEQWIAFVKENEDSGFFQMIIFDKNGQNMKILFEDSLYCNDIVWIKNKPELIYNGFNGYPNTGYLKIFNLENSKTLTLWDNNTDNLRYPHEVCNSISNKIVFFIPVEESLASLCTIEKDGSNFKEIARLSCYKLTYINNKIYFIDYGDPSNIIDDKLAVITDDGSGYEQLSKNTDNGIYDYDISPDGTEIIYMYWSGPGDDILYHSDIFGNGHRPIFYLDSAALSRPGLDYINDPTFSSDGQKILFSQKSSVLTILDFKTLEFEQFDLNIIGNVYNASWIDNDEKIVFSTNENNQFNLCLIKSNGTGYKKVISNKNNWYTFKESPIYN